MAHNTKVSADADAPPVTHILADFVAGHPSQGWDASVDKEAHRTLLNWVGCAIGASHHPTVKAALAAIMELAPNAQATILGRRERVDIASAALLNGITSHRFRVQLSQIHQEETPWKRARSHNFFRDSGG